MCFFSPIGDMILTGDGTRSARANIFICDHYWGSQSVSMSSFGLQLGLGNLAPLAWRCQRDSWGQLMTFMQDSWGQLGTVDDLHVLGTVDDFHAGGSPSRSPSPLLSPPFQ